MGTSLAPDCPFCHGSAQQADCNCPGWCGVFGCGAMPESEYDENGNPIGVDDDLYDDEDEDF